MLVRLLRCRGGEADLYDRAVYRSEGLGSVQYPYDNGLANA